MGEGDARYNKHFDIILLQTRLYVYTQCEMGLVQ